jgi:hypothetical protein
MGSGLDNDVHMGDIMNTSVISQCRSSAATKSVFRLQVSGFRIWGLLTPDT